MSAYQEGRDEHEPYPVETRRSRRVRLHQVVICGFDGT